MHTQSREIQVLVSLGFFAELYAFWLSFVLVDLRSPVGLVAMQMYPLPFLFRGGGGGGCGDGGG